MKNKTAVYFLPIFILIFISGCSGRPSNILSEKKMVDVMVDMELAEAYVNTNPGFSSQDRVELGKRVLKVHNVSEESLDTTLAWYGRNMDEYTSLFEKVDKEIEKRKKKYTEIPGEKHKEPDNLWPYNPHLIISPLAGTNAFVFSVKNPDINKGDVIEFSSFLPNSTAVKGTLGVEYTDGHGEAIVSNFQTKNKIEISLQSDTVRAVDRIFGIMSVKDTKSLPLYLDSITLKATPIDSLSYRSKRRSQKTFGPLVLE